MEKTVTGAEKILSAEILKGEKLDFTQNDKGIEMPFCERNGENTKTIIFLTYCIEFIYSRGRCHVLAIIFLNIIQQTKERIKPIAKDNWLYEIK